MNQTSAPGSNQPRLARLGNGSWAVAYKTANAKKTKREKLELLYKTGIVSAKEVEEDNATISEEHIRDCVGIADEMLRRSPCDVWTKQPELAKSFFEHELTKLYNVLGHFVDVLTGISAPFIGLIDDALDHNWDLRFPLGDECALGMLFYYSVRLHWCLSQVKSETENYVASILDNEEFRASFNGAGNCWAMSEADGQMIEMYARWPMRVVLASKWPFVLFLMHEEIVWKDQMASGELIAERHKVALAKNPLRSKTFYLETRKYTVSSGNFSKLLDFFWDDERKDNVALNDVAWHDGVYPFIYQKDSD
eukprot:g15272.t1